MIREGRNFERTGHTPGVYENANRITGTAGMGAKVNIY